MNAKLGNLFSLYFFSVQGCGVREKFISFSFRSSWGIILNKNFRIQKNIMEKSSVHKTCSQVVGDRS